MALNRLHKGALVSLGLMFGLMAQATLGLPYQPSFGLPTLNFWAVALTFAMVPVVAIWIARSLAPALQRRVDLWTVTCLIAPCLFIAVGCLLAAPTLGKEAATPKLLGEARAGWPVYKLYQTNCGTPCSFGLVLEEERPLAAGFKLVTPMWRKFGIDQGTLELGPTSVRVVHGTRVLGEVPR